MKKRTALVLSILSFLVASLVADKPLGEPVVKHVNAKQGGELWKANKDSDQFVVLDVRTAKEVEAVRIPKAKNVDFLEDGFAEKVAKLDKQRTYLVHCRSGGRSQSALKVLQKLGFLKLYHLDGGMLAWEKEGLQVERGK